MMEPHPPSSSTRLEPELPLGPRKRVPQESSLLPDLQRDRPAFGISQDLVTRSLVARLHQADLIFRLEPLIDCAAVAIGYKGWLVSPDLTPFAVPEPWMDVDSLEVKPFLSVDQQSTYEVNGSWRYRRQRCRIFRLWSIVSGFGRELQKAMPMHHFLLDIVPVVVIKRCRAIETLV